MVRHSLVWSCVCCWARGFWCRCTACGLKLTCAAAAVAAGSTEQELADAVTAAVKEKQTSGQGRAVAWDGQTTGGQHLRTQVQEIKDNRRDYTGSSGTPASSSLPQAGPSAGAPSQQQQKQQLPPPPVLPPPPMQPPRPPMQQQQQRPLPPPPMGGPMRPPPPMGGMGMGMGGPPLPGPPPPGMMRPPMPGPPPPMGMGGGPPPMRPPMPMPPPPMGGGGGGLPPPPMGPPGGAGSGGSSRPGELNDCSCLYSAVAFSTMSCPVGRSSRQLGKPGWGCGQLHGPATSFCCS
jgi:hypothetical protein